MQKYCLVLFSTLKTDTNQAQAREASPPPTSNRIPQLVTWPSLLLVVGPSGTPQPAHATHQGPTAGRLTQVTWPQQGRQGREGRQRTGCASRTLGGVQPSPGRSVPAPHPPLPRWQVVARNQADRHQVQVPSVRIVVGQSAEQWVQWWGFQGIGHFNKRHIDGTKGGFGFDKQRTIQKENQFDLIHLCQ